MLLAEDHSSNGGKFPQKQEYEKSARAVHQKWPFARFFAFGVQKYWESSGMLEYCEIWFWEIQKMGFEEKNLPENVRSVQFNGQILARFDIRSKKFGIGLEWKGYKMGDA